MTDTVLSVKDLRVAFGRQQFAAVKGISYDLLQGEKLAIVGESGSGKSVSSMALMGLLPPEAHVTGRARFGGRDLLKMDDESLRRIRGNDISMIFQEPMTSLTPVLTIGRQLTEIILEHNDVSRADARSRAIELLGQVRLSDPQDRLAQYPHQLSGGMRQRVMIAIALANRPKILIADEPTTALDVTVQAQTLRLMTELCETNGTALLLITHDMGVVAETADRVLVMQQGEMVEDAPVRQLFAAPRHRYTRTLLEAVPRLGAYAGVDGPQGQGARKGKPLVVASGLQKTFVSRKGERVTAMDDMSFDLAAHETLGLVGESGSGKSTTGRAVLRLMDPDAGDLMFDGQNISSATRRQMRSVRRHMQMIFQDPLASLNPTMRADRIVAEPMRIHGLSSGSELTDRVETLFARVGLAREHLSRYPHELSGGQRQRLSIARALGVGPKMIVADEPTSALDVSVQAQVLDLMREMQSEMGLAYLFVSHDMAVIEEMCHRVAVMHRGRIVEIGTRANVLGDPRHPYTKALLNAVPVPDPTRVRGVIADLTPDDYPTGPLTEISPGHMVASA